MSLRAVKLLHTVVWAFFAACIVALPIAASLGRFVAAAWLAGLVAMECVVLVVNRFRCPLTDVAARFTEDRAANFDIYLPLWLARNNQQIFGTLYALGLVYTAITWWRA